MTPTWTPTWPLRSSLFVPAHRSSWVAKAIRSGTDAVVLDLEDSVPPDHRNEARQSLAAEIQELTAAKVAPFVRINPLSDQSHLDVDSAVVPGLAGIMLPKASTPDQVRQLHDMISYREGKQGIAHGEVAILPLPETAFGLQHAEALAAASPRVKGIVSVMSGPIAADVAQAFGFEPSLEGTEQNYMNSKLVLDSRAGGAPFPVVGVFGFSDLPSIEVLIRRAKAFGYTGCVVMHPSHVEIVNRVFAPTAEEAEYFSGMLEAFAAAEAAGKGAVNYRGLMIDYAMLPLARRVTGEYQRRAARAQQADTGA